MTDLECRNLRALETHLQKVVKSCMSQDGWLVVGNKSTVTPLSDSVCEIWCHSDRQEREFTKCSTVY